MQMLTEEEMLEIKGGDWADAGKGFLWSAGIGLTIFIVSQTGPFCRRILSSWRGRRPERRE
jgi:hypothetical protein